MNASTKILVVDDEPPIRRLLRTMLTAKGFEVTEASSGTEALEKHKTGRPDLIILDLGLPDMDGLEIIRALRKDKLVTPIVVLSARGEEAIKVDALNAGADDYVTKPFGMAELIARVQTALRHRLQQQGAQAVFDSGGLHVDLVHRVVTVDGRDVKLTPKEFEILRLLVIHAGKVLTHRMIMTEVWGAAGDVQYLRIYIRQLRAKMEPKPDQPEHILTETGVGYRLQVHVGP